MKTDKNYSSSPVGVIEKAVRENKSVTTTTKLRYRYYCDHCTGTAFVSESKVKFAKSMCQSCGKEISECKIENYIML